MKALLLLPLAVILFILSSGQLFTSLARYRTLRIVTGVFAVLAALLMLKDYLPSEVNAHLVDAWSRLRQVAERPACAPGHRRDDALRACVPDNPRPVNPPQPPKVVTSPPQIVITPEPTACQEGEELWNARCTCKGGWYRDDAGGKCIRLER